jgi:hypothetical protein
LWIWNVSDCCGSQFKTKKYSLVSSLKVDVWLQIELNTRRTLHFTHHIQNNSIRICFVIS